jgi:hypothetical protein
MRITELGKGKEGSIFASGDLLIYAKREGRTLRGLQIWRITVKKEGKVIEDKVIYLKHRSELRDAVRMAASAASRRA